jgi:hypothetical protein
MIDMTIAPLMIGRTIRRTKLVDEEAAEHFDCNPGRLYIPEIYFFCFSIIYLRKK